MKSQQIDNLASDELAAHLVILGFDGPKLPTEVGYWLKKGLAGVALFKRNIVDRNQVRSLCDQIYEAAYPIVPIISVDQEGGRVQRLRGLLTEVPPSAKMGDDQYYWGKTIGQGLAELGFNLDFAPVLDVHTNPTNPIIGDRAFSQDPQKAAVLALEFLAGLKSTGVKGCGKHFPGHGDANKDSHLELPVLELTQDVLFQRELVPFKAAIDAGIEMIMTAHCMLPAIDPRYIATLSKILLTDILRNRLGFEGCIITDDLGMAGISKGYTMQQITACGLDAGIDLFLHCGAALEGIAVIENLQRLIETSEESRALAIKAAQRVEAFRFGLQRFSYNS